jgi:hypothetical protein
MPDDNNSDRLLSIKRDLDYYRQAHMNMGVGGQPPTVHASKYASDVGFLFDLLHSYYEAKIESNKYGALVAELHGTPLGKSQLEVALEHDKVGRMERRSKPTP